MKLTYDPRYNIACLRLKERTAEVETLHIGDSLNVDIAPDGTVQGIEFLNANEQLLGVDGPMVEVVNEAQQSRHAVPLT